MKKKKKERNHSYIRTLTEEHKEILRAVKHHEEVDINNIRVQELIMVSALKEGQRGLILTNEGMRHA